MNLYLFIYNLDKFLEMNRSWRVGVFIVEEIWREKSAVDPFLH